MAIPTSRTNEKAEIRINTEKFTNCGLCASVCKDFSLVMEDHGIKSQSREGLFVVFSHTSVKFRKGIKRSFAPARIMS